jgi:hypothetical protein
MAAGKKSPGIGRVLPAPGENLVPSRKLMPTSFNFCKNSPVRRAALPGCFAVYRVIFL